jgi:NADH:ubiquinone oxidoreductase subunit E
MDSKSTICVSTICMSSIVDSINTSISMKIFKNKEEAAYSHIFNSKLVKIPLNTFKNDNVDNFYSVKLQKSAVKAYPLTDRPRGKEDISSVKYYQKQIQQKKGITPVWMIQKNKKYILLDGAHRIVASYIEDMPVYAYIINI